MKLNLKDEPKEWRKSALLAIFGLALISSVLRWRHVITNQNWLIALAVLALLGMVASAQPRWFRGYHLFSMRLGFVISRFLGAIFLVLFFLLILTPVGWLLRLSGKDPLRLKCLPQPDTYWQSAKDCAPLDRMF